MSRIEISRAVTADDFSTGRALMLDYARSLDFSLCFQGFDRELQDAERIYAPPEGALLLATRAGAAVGVVGIRRLDAEAAEMKRLYVVPALRGSGLGRRLAEAAIAEARRLGYRLMRLDTAAPKMREAVGLYRSLGFTEIPPYYEGNPLADILYLERAL